MEGFIKEKLVSLGVDEEVFGPYIVALLEEEDVSDDDLKDRLSMTLEGAGAEQFEAFVDDCIAKKKQRIIEQKEMEELKKKKILEESEKKIQDSKKLRGEESSNVNEVEEDLEERLRRLELIKRYEEPDEMEMDETGRVYIRADAKNDAGIAIGLIGVEGNDNAERVKREEAAKRQKERELAKKQKETSKSTTQDGKKKKEEAKEKRRQKATKVERRKM